MTNELNPSNEALTQLREHWQKICVLLMIKHGISEFTIDAADFAPLLRPDPPVVVIIGRKQIGPNGGFTIKVAPNQAAALEIVARYQGTG